jgi:hypothetical protein
METHEKTWHQSGGDCQACRTLTENLLEQIKNCLFMMLSIAGAEI